MTSLQYKIDFIGLIEVNRANPNGDPLSENMPRTDFEGYGEISDVALKRKIRNRLQDMGERIFVQSDERRDDNYASLRERAEADEDLNKAAKNKDREAFAKRACELWIDTRAFGQVFAFKKGGDAKGLSVGVRGPVSIREAVSQNIVTISHNQITKSVNSEGGEGGKSSDTMGMKYRVDFGVYKFAGSINVQLSEKTGFSEADAEKIHEALKTLFENDASSARPEGSMVMKRLYWFKHNNKTGQHSSYAVHNSVNLKLKDDVEAPSKFDDYKIEETKLEGLTPEVYIEG